MNNIIRKKFDKGNPNWDENPEFSKLYLNAQRNYFNDVMQIQGFVFLRDVYMGLGLATTKESCMLGWVKGVVAGADFVKFDLPRLKGQTISNWSSSVIQYLITWKWRMWQVKLPFFFFSRKSPPL